MDFAQHVGKGYGAAWRGIIFRREYKELADVEAKSRKWFSQIFPDARFLESAADYKWKFATGEELLFRAAKKESDYWNYHGHEYPWIGWEELCSWPNLKLYESMRSTNRSSHPGMPRRYVATANPYGPGHNVVKAYFIDPAPAMQPIRDAEGRIRIRISGKMWENPHLIENDPDYVKNIRAITDPNKRRAWLYGDWNIVAGGMFDDLWSESKHIIAPFDVPAGWLIRRAFDWGSSRPFSVGWWAHASGEEVKLRGSGVRQFYRGSRIRIAEWYGWNGQPNEGLHMTATAIAQGIFKIEKEIGLTGRVKPGPADSGIFVTDNGVCIADDMARVGVRWIPAQKGPKSRVNGWDKFRDMLEASLHTPMEKPGVFTFETNRQFIRTVPVLPRDERDPDDVDTEAEDHPADETRYELTTPTMTAGKVKVVGV